MVESMVIKSTNLALASERIFSPANDEKPMPAFLEVQNVAGISEWAEDINARIADELGNAVDRAYVTLATQSYSFGLLGLYRSIRARSKLPLICLLDGELDKSPFFDTDIIFVTIPRIINRSYAPTRQEYSAVLSKLWAFGLTAIEKVVFLDSDIAVQHNIDHLFEFPAPSFAPDYVDHVHTQRFNSGVFVVRPERAEFMRLISYAGTAKSLDNADQGLLNGYYCANHFWLPSIYNTLKHCVYYTDGVTRDQNDISVIHYIAKKPWELFYRELVDAKLVPIERQWTKHLTKEDLLRLIEHWRKEMFTLHERDGFFYKKENKKLLRRQRRMVAAIYALSVTALLSLALWVVK